MKTLLTSVSRPSLKIMNYIKKIMRYIYIERETEIKGVGAMIVAALLVFFFSIKRKKKKLKYCVCV